MRGVPSEPAPVAPCQPDRSKTRGSGPVPGSVMAGGVMGQGNAAAVSRQDMVRFLRSVALLIALAAPAASALAQETGAPPVEPAPAVDSAAPAGPRPGTAPAPIGAPALDPAPPSVPLWLPRD